MKSFATLLSAACLVAIVSSAPLDTLQGHAATALQERATTALNEHAAIVPKERALSAQTKRGGDDDQCCDPNEEDCDPESCYKKRDVYGQLTGRDPTALEELTQIAQSKRDDDDDQCCDPNEEDCDPESCYKKRDVYGQLKGRAVITLNERATDARRKRYSLECRVLEFDNDRIKLQC